MDSFNQSETLSWLPEVIDDEELKKFIETLNDPLLDNNLQQPRPLLINNEEVEGCQQFGENSELGNLSLVPSLGLLDCSGCVLLRELVHTNGLQNVKLAIHGGCGTFHHATLEVTCNVDGLPPVIEPSVIDLRDQNYKQVKQFLIDYEVLRVQNGYVLIHDSISSFYDALSVRLNFDATSTSDDGSTFPEQGLLCQSSSTVSGVNDPIRTEKTGIAAQRKRTANLHINDFADYFHLRIIDAAKEIGICPTVLKKICRKHGMRRWPYRKIKSIDNNIKKLEDDLLAHGGHGSMNTQAEIERLRAQRARICHGHKSAQEQICVYD